MSSPPETLLSKNEKLEAENKELKHLIRELITWHRQCMQTHTAPSQGPAAAISPMDPTRLHQDIAAAREIIATAEKLKDVLRNNAGERSSHLQITQQQDAIIAVQREIISALEQKLGKH
ncbi:hypothetical protein BP6252_07345 [Coleophoma cylindrospora]|uniref:Uncharacterized protein n=1 Tax=Coleophoma cylindrospora TaxID=1849047 RepID=A0A3D8RHN2_9HELO|nr:hypothetical protein BP6252_07345 [Coleophoma cylindrospora]